MCNRSPAGMNIAAGEYGYEIFYFRRMLEAKAVDVLQADATRCCGFTGFFQACQLSRAFNIPLSSHTAPSLHIHPCTTQAMFVIWSTFMIMRVLNRYFLKAFPN